MGIDNHLSYVRCRANDTLSQYIVQQSTINVAQFITNHAIMIEPGLDLVTKNVDLKPEQMCRNVPTETKPHILHYCQRLALGKYLMSKHRLPDDFVGQSVSCEKPLLKEPPDDVALKYNFFVDKGSGKRYDIRDQGNGKYTGQDKINQAAFMLCEELQAFNRGATYYKQNHCDAKTANLEKTLMFFDSTELTVEERKQKGEIV
jgi:hypothetical protein